MVIEGVPQGIAFADEEQLQPELLREVYLATHMTDWVVDVIERGFLPQITRITQP